MVLLYNFFIYLSKLYIKFNSKYFFLKYTTII